MFSTYAKLSSRLLAVRKREREREREDTHMQGTVFTSARLKIVPTIKNLYCIQSQSALVDCVERGSLV